MAISTVLAGNLIGLEIARTLYNENSMSVTKAREKSAEIRNAESRSQEVREIGGKVKELRRAAFSGQLRVWLLVAELHGQEQCT